MPALGTRAAAVLQLWEATWLRRSGQQVCASQPDLRPPFHPICVCPAEGQQAQEQQAGTSHPSRAERAQRRWEQHVPGSEDEDDGSLSDDGDDPDLEAQMEVGLAVVQQLAECSGNPLLNSLHALGLRGAHVCF